MSNTALVDKKCQWDNMPTSDVHKARTAFDHID